jgi:hypothetical protein
MKQSLKIYFLITFTLILVGCTEVVRQFVDMRGYKYCEILFQFEDRTEVWGTQGLNRCPSDDWDELDFNELRDTSGAVNLIPNGPRYFVINSSQGMNLPDGDPKYFENLEMKKLATTGPIDIAEPFTEISVFRDNTWIFREGNEVYLLTSPNGSKYVMQSFSQIVDKDMEESDLPHLGEKIDLPAGWNYEVEILEDELLAHANGEAIVLQDTLRNVYQKL